MHDKISHARGWFRKADSDLQTPRKLLSAQGPLDAVCFHAQQAAEKYLKGPLALKEELAREAVLVAEQVRPAVMSFVPLQAQP